MLEKYNSNSTCKLIYKQKEKGKKWGKSVCSLGNREKEQFIEKINKRYLKRKMYTLVSIGKCKVLCVILESLNVYF